MEKLLAVLTPANLSLAAAYAGVPDMIRGFGHVKAANMKKAEARYTETRSCFVRARTSAASRRVGSPRLDLSFKDAERGRRADGGKDDAEQLLSRPRFRPWRKRRHASRNRPRLLRKRDRAARRRNRPHQHLPARLVGADGRARSSRHHRRGGMGRRRARLSGTLPRHGGGEPGQRERRPLLWRAFEPLREPDPAQWQR